MFQLQSQWLNIAHLVSSVLTLALVEPYNNHCLKSVQIQSFFWSLFSCIWTEYRDLRSISPYSIRMQENADRKRLYLDTFPVVKLSPYCDDLITLKSCLSSLLAQNIFLSHTSYLCNRINLSKKLSRENTSVKILFFNKVASFSL